MKNYFILLVLFCLALPSFGQVQTPQPSPEATVSQNVGLSEVSVNYSRPSAKGRTIFGGLVPFGELWRTGANGSTDITFSQEVTFGGKKVPAGTYSIYTIPRKDMWDVILYTETEHWGTPSDYSESKAAAVAKVAPSTSSSRIESFTIEFDDLRNSSASIVLAWDQTVVKVPITLNTTEEVQKSIDSALAGPTANDYFSAARYYFEEGLDMNKAYEWVKKATSMNDKAFWMLKVQAEIEAQMGNNFDAIQTAKKSIELAEKAGNNQYIEFNKANIAKWSKR